MLKSFSFGRDKSPGAKSDDERAASARFNTQRECLRMVVKETLRTQGLPATWVGSELVAAGTDASGPQFRLVVQEWQEGLLRYLPALQAVILTALNTMDPSLKANAQGVSWQFAADCGCPHDQLPPAANWGGTSGMQALQLARQEDDAASADTVSKPVAPTKPKFDLPLSDRDRLHTSDWDAIPSTYAATQPGFLATQPAGIDAGKSGS
jgi:hypothetical protein